MLFKLAAVICFRLLNDLLTSTSIASDTNLGISFYDFSWFLQYSYLALTSSILSILSHRVLRFFCSLSYDDLSRAYSSISSFSNSWMSLLSKSMLLRSSSLSIYLIVIPSIWVLSLKPKALSLLPLLYSDQINCSFSVNILAVIFWFDYNSVNSKCILDYST